MCVLDAVKSINVKVFNPILRANKKRYKKLHETCKRKCRLDPNVCNNKKHWKKKKYTCGCKEVIGKGICDKEFI